MDSLKKRFKHLKVWRDHSLGGLPDAPSKSSSTQSAALQLSYHASPTPQAKDTLVASARTSLTAVIHKPQSNALTNEQWSAQLWERALDAVKSSPEWADFHKITSRKTVGQSCDLDNQTDHQGVLQQIEETTKEIMASKARTQDNGLQMFLSKTMKTLQAVKSLGDAAVAVNPYAALGWNVVHFGIAVALKYQNVKEDVCETLPKVLELVIRYQTWFGIYAGTGAIQILRQQHDDTLVGIYTALLGYQIAVVVCLDSKMTRFKHAISPDARSQHQQALEELSRREEHWQSLRPIIDREITDTHFEEVGDSLQQLKQASATILDELKHVADSIDTQLRALRVKILGWISPIDSEAAHTETKRQPLPHTSDWLMKHPDYISWETDVSTNCLWLRGDPGTGKSCLAYAVIEDQRAKRSSSQLEANVIFVYCDGTDAVRKGQIATHEKMLRSLVKQLVASTSGPLPTEVHKIYDEQRNLREEEWLDILLSLSDPSVELSIIIDGVDECDDQVQIELMTCLRSLMSKRGQRLRLLIACRYTVALDNLLQELSPREINVVDHTEAAIRTMVESTVRKKQQSPTIRFLYLMDSIDLTNKVIDTVTNMAGGMFRYAQLALDRLHMSRSPDFFDRRLEGLKSLPALDSLYEEQWKESVADLDDLEKEVVITALNLQIYGFPYGVRENVQDPSLIHNDQHIVEACSLVLKGKVEKSFTVRRLVATCPSFLSESAPGRGTDPHAQASFEPRLRIFHFSVTEYLVNRQSRWFSPGAAHAAIAQLCVRTFDLFGVHENLDKIFSQHPPNGLALYAVMCWPEHIRLCQKANRSGSQADLLSPKLCQFLLDSFCSRSFETWTTMMKRFRVNIIERCRGPVFLQGETIEFPRDPLDALLNGAQNDKLLVGSSLITQPPSSLFARLYLSFSIEDLDFPLAGVRGTWEYGGTTVTPQTFAATFGLLPAIDSLKRRGCSPNELDDRGETTGHVLCTAGLITRDDVEASFPSTLRALIRAGLDLTIKDRKGNTCLFHVLQSKDFDAEVLQIFQEQKFDLLAFEPAFGCGDDGDSMLPLDYAIDCLPRTEHRTRTLDALLSYYAEFYVDADSRDRWLRRAIRRNDTELVKLLVEKYNASPLCRDHLGLMALQFAIAYGWRHGSIGYAIVDYLAPFTLKPGCDVDAMKTKVRVLELLVASCKSETIRLYNQYAVPTGSLYAAWGTRAITHTLLWNKKHGTEIADYLYSIGYENAGDSRVYQAWTRGELEDDEIGRCSEDEKYLFGIDAVTEDMTLDAEFLDAPENMG